LIIISKQRKQSVAELVRHAIDQTYIKEEAVDFELALKKGMGIWKDRSDIKDDYVRNLREDARIERVHARRSY